jgi:hypothetical protein
MQQALKPPCRAGTGDTTGSSNVCHMKMMHFVCIMNRVDMVCWLLGKGVQPKSRGKCVEVRNPPRLFNREACLSILVTGRN